MPAPCRATPAPDRIALALVAPSPDLHRPGHLRVALVAPSPDRVALALVAPSPDRHRPGRLRAESLAPVGRRAFPSAPEPVASRRLARAPVRRPLPSRAVCRRPAELEPAPVRPCLAPARPCLRQRPCPAPQCPAPVPSAQPAALLRPACLLCAGWPEPCGFSDGIFPSLFFVGPRFCWLLFRDLFGLFYVFDLGCFILCLGCLGSIRGSRIAWLICDYFLLVPGKDFLPWLCGPCDMSRLCLVCLLIVMSMIVIGSFV